GKTTAATRPEGGPWTCKRDCEQGYPRLPDDGQWECADLDGVAVCRGGVAAAGVVPGPPDPGWRCGAKPDGERVCIDATAETPAGGRGWLCHFTHAPIERRVCEHDAKGPPVGAPCEAGCAPDTHCAGGRCELDEPKPGCWLDEDCHGGRCMHGSCR